MVTDGYNCWWSNTSASGKNIKATKSFYFHFLLLLVIRLFFRVVWFALAFSLSFAFTLKQVSGYRSLKKQQEYKSLKPGTDFLSVGIGSVHQKAPLTT